LVDSIGLDVEADGLFAYRAHLCTLQLALYPSPPADSNDREASSGEPPEIVIVDALAVHPAPLADLLGPHGPPKILHDLTFDARMLQGVGITVGNVVDTSVVARLLGRKATGLASLLETELGVRVAKQFQQHDWRIRPIGDSELDYLADDVRHLGGL